MPLQAAPSREWTLARRWTVSTMPAVTLAAAFGLIGGAASGEGIRCTILGSGINANLSTPFQRDSNWEIVANLSGRGQKTTRPGGNGVDELSLFAFLDRLADLVPLPRKHRHRYHGVCAPNHKLRPAVTHTGYAHARRPFWASGGTRPSQ